MKTVMILAAGRGERLKPLTNFIPKAMCQIDGKPIIEHHVVNLARSGFKRIVINHAYLGGQIRQHLGNGNQWNIEICYSPEPPGGLETGGGIVNALPLLGQEPFLVINGDIYTDFDFTTLNCLPNFLAHVILVPNPAHNLKGDFNLEGLRLTNERRYTFAGITYYRPEIFHQYPIGRYSITPLLRGLTTQQKICGSIYEGVWADIGSPKQLNDFKLHTKTCLVA